MALSVATTHTWQLDLATDSNSHTMDSSSNGPSRGAQDTTEASTPTVGTQPGSSLGHGQPTGNQLYHTGGAFPAPPQYFDPNQQIAWAYQQMMMQQAALAQQHHQNQFNQAMAELGR
ncbi:9801_t:CDS:2, partial [Acaulospora colombiana]